MAFSFASDLLLLRGAQSPELIGYEVAESDRLGRAQLLANFVDELDDVWLGSQNRLGAVIPPS